MGYLESWILGALPGEAEGHAKTHCGQGPRRPQGVGGVSTHKWGGLQGPAGRPLKVTFQGDWWLLIVPGRRAGTVTSKCLCALRLEFATPPPLEYFGQLKGMR